MIEGLAQTV